jgi:hypothetical protein
MIRRERPGPEAKSLAPPRCHPAQRQDRRDSRPGCDRAGGSPSCDRPAYASDWHQMPTHSNPGSGRSSPGRSNLGGPRVSRFRPAVSARHIGNRQFYRCGAAGSDEARGVVAEFRPGSSDQGRRSDRGDKRQEDRRRGARLVPPIRCRRNMASGPPRECSYCPISAVLIVARLFVENLGRFLDRRKLKEAVDGAAGYKSEFSRTSVSLARANLAKREAERNIPGVRTHLMCTSQHLGSLAAATKYCPTERLVTARESCDRTKSQIFLRLDNWPEDDLIGQGGGFGRLGSGGMVGDDAGFRPGPRTPLPVVRRAAGRAIGIVALPDVSLTLDRIPGHIAAGFLDCEEKRRLRGIKSREHNYARQFARARFPAATPDRAGR